MMIGMEIRMVNPKVVRFLCNEMSSEMSSQTSSETIEKRPRKMFQDSNLHSDTYFESHLLGNAL